LNFEVFRSRIRARSYDATTDNLVFTATIPDYLDVYVKEIALISSSSDADASIVTSFDEATEQWEGGTFTTANARYGDDALLLSGVTASTYTDTRPALAGISLSDTIQVAYFGAGGTVDLRFNNTAEDYHSTTFTATSGYNVARIPVSSLVKAGVPDLASANGITITHAGTGSITLDAIRVSHASNDDTLIVRQLLPEAYRKPAGLPMDIELPMVVTR